MTYSIRLWEKPAFQGRTEHLSDPHLDQDSPNNRAPTTCTSIRVTPGFPQIHENNLPTSRQFTSLGKRKRKRQPHTLKVYLWKIILPGWTEEKTAQSHGSQVWGTRTHVLSHDPRWVRVLHPKASNDYFLNVYCGQIPGKHKSKNLKPLKRLCKRRVKYV